MIRWFPGLWSLLISVTTGLLLWGPTASADDAKPTDITRADFVKADANKDKVLTIEEHRTLSSNPAVQDRNFRVFDFDGDGKLTFEEFAAIPGRGPRHLRGAIPHPLEAILDLAVAAMDEAYNGWDRTPNRTIHAQTFILDFASSLRTDGIRFYKPELIPLADSNGDGQVTREEARRFLEIQLGIRSQHGHRFLEPTGVVVAWLRFPYLDINQDGTITREEFLERAGRPKAAEEFDIYDINKDGRLSLEEFLDPRWDSSYDDPVATFLWRDKNLDGFVDRDELAQSLEDYDKPVPDMTFPAFDDDGDGKLSLMEYLLSPPANRFCPWRTAPVDKNRDKSLSVDEFTFTGMQPNLLWRLYFDRLDRNHDGKLDEQEFAFRKIPPNTILLVSIDGSETRKVFRSEDHPNVNSPAISPDGKWIICDRYPENMLMKFTIEGKEVQQIGDGLMPTWSADGKKITFAHQSQAWICNADGSNRVSLGNGWGTQWSPDGKMVTFYRNTVLCVYDVESETTRDVIDLKELGYTQLYWNGSWTPDSKRFGLKAIKPDAQEIVSVNMVDEEPDPKVHLSMKSIAQNDFTWSADGSQFYIGLAVPGQSKTRVFLVDSGNGENRKQVEGIPDELSVSSVSLSPDGQWIMIVGRE